VFILPDLGAIRELNMPVDRTERVTSMSCDDTVLPFVLAFDSNQNSPSNHFAKQGSALLLL